MRRIWKALFYSLAGLKAAFLNEAAFRQELLMSVVLIPIALFLKVPTGQKILLIISISIVLIVEVINSAIEAIVDLASPEKHDLAKRAKDMGSAAVFLSLLNMVVVWLWVLFLN